MYGPLKPGGFLRVAEDVVPIAAFKARLSQVVRELPGRGRPMVITQNGKPAAVLLSPRDFDDLTYRRRFLSAIKEGLDDLQADRVLSHDEVGSVLDARFGRTGKAKRR
jgi:prevent-host-death family protein